MIPEPTDNKDNGEGHVSPQKHIKTMLPEKFLAYV